MATSLLARLGRITGSTSRIIEVRNVASSQEVGSALLALPSGAAVFLVGSGPPWHESRSVALSPWSEDLGSVANLWASRRETHRANLLQHATSHGVWTRDDRGIPCELAFESSLRGPMGVIIVNYAGWRISHFPDGETDVVVCSGPGGRPVWIVTPDAVPRPREEVPGNSPAEQRSISPSQGPSHERESAVVRPATPANRVIGSFELQLRFVDLQFAEGAVSFSHRGQTLCIASEHAREVYGAVGDLLDEELPVGVRASGRVHADGSVIGQVEGLEALAAIFEKVQRKRFIRESCSTTTWLDADGLAERIPGGKGRRDPTDLLDIEDFVAGRKAAFRLLFMHRDPSEFVRILPRRAVVVPLPARDGGLRWYAWETIQDALATYLFRPSSEEALERMLAWTQIPKAPRRELRGSRELQEELGYVDWVEHDLVGNDPLGRWWRELCAKVGLRGS